MIFCTSCGDDDFNEPQPVKSKYCNTEARLTIDHHLSDDGYSYIAPFFDKEELRFVPMATEYDSTKNIDDVWVWKKEDEHEEWGNHYFLDLPCPEDSSLLDKTYSTVRGAWLKYHDEKNEQSFRFFIKGVHEIIDKVPVGVKGEVFEMTIKSDHSSRATHIINYFTNDTAYYEYPCSDPSTLVEETTIDGRKLTDFITMEVPGENDKYKVFYKKSKGIVLLQEIATGEYWEPLNEDDL